MKSAITKCWVNPTSSTLIAAIDTLWTETKALIETRGSLKSSTTEIGKRKKQKT